MSETADLHTIAQASDIRSRTRQIFGRRVSAKAQDFLGGYGEGDRTVFRVWAPDRASAILTVEDHTWRDGGWLRYRSEHFTRDAINSEPINVYELHLGTWACREDGSPMTYSELARELTSYVKQMGYTHVALLRDRDDDTPLTWGEWACESFTPSDRHGNPKDFMGFVDSLHEAGIGVLVDWLPAEFGSFDIDLGREEVQAFLLSGVLYLIEAYHVDGLRVEALDAILYLDYGKGDGEWTPNAKGGNERLEAIDFFKKLNAFLAREYPDVITVASDRSIRGDVTGELGFTLRANTGWQDTALFYTEQDPLWRKFHHRRLVTEQVRAYGERYVLPISADTVSGGRRSLLDKCPGEYLQKFAGARVFLAYMMTHPGKKLLFMGSELGQFCEFHRRRTTEWFLTEFETHARLQQYTAELGQFYLSEPSLWQRDGDRDGFVWIDADDADHSTYSYRRIDADGRELLILLNFTPVVREDYLLAVPSEGVYEEVFNSDAPRYGGTGVKNTGLFRAEPHVHRAYRHAIRITAPPLAAVIFRKTEDGS